MYSVKLTKIHSGHQHLRTNEIVGTALDLPAVGKIFKMFGEPLDAEASYRQITTSPIQSVIMFEPDRRLSFSTMNSEYELEFELVIK